MFREGTEWAEDSSCKEGAAERPPVPWKNALWLGMAVASSWVLPQTVWRKQVVPWPQFPHL